MFRKDDARPGGNAGLEAQVGGDAELARSGRSRVPYRIGNVVGSIPSDASITVRLICISERADCSGTLASMT
jgi:hypothetical protein